MAITINYLEAGNVFLGSSTPPTAKQAFQGSTVVATVQPSANADAAATITHNLGIPSSDLQMGWPFISILELDNLAQTSNWSLQSSDPNWVGLLKSNVGAGADTVPQIRVTIGRPHTMWR